MAYINGKQVLYGVLVQQQGGHTDEDIDNAYNEGYAAGYTVGGESKLSGLWANIQKGGAETNYHYAFAYNRLGSYAPQYDILCVYSSETPTAGEYVFYGNTEIENTLVPIRVTGGTISNMFCRCSLLETIPLLELTGVTKCSGAFTGCKSLEEIRIAGSIDVSISFAASPLLSQDSINSIIAALKDLTGATAQKLTLHATVYDALTETQITSITNKNWTIAKG